MKRTTLSALLILCLLFSCAVSAAALDPLQRFVDDAHLITDTNKSGTLEQRMTDILYTYDMDIVILTVDTLGSKSATAYADDFYDESGYGIDGRHSGLLLLIAMDEREWAVSTCGDAINAVTDYEIDTIVSNIVDDLSDGRYYEAFNNFLDQIEAEYQAFLDDKTVDSGEILIRFAIALAIGAVISGIVILIMRSKMNTAKQQRGAGNYLIEQSYDLFRCHDIFLYSHTSKTRKAESSSGGSTHRSSSGRSHGGSSGRF